MNFWDFWHQHWFLAWCALWLGWGVVWLAAIVAEVVWRLTNRLLSTIKICVRGWTPEHLDADGDWKPEPKQEVQDENK